MAGLSDADGQAEGRRGFADLLLDLRVQAGLSQEELADRAGLSVRTIRELEAGRVARPRKDSVRLLSKDSGCATATAGKFLAAVSHATVRPVIAVADPAPTGLRWRGTRPIPDGLVGREKELLELEKLLRQNRLVTLVGPGGVGKTELALAAADRVSSVDTAVVVVDLTTVQRDAAVPSAILDAFGTAPGTSDLDDVLSGRKPGDLVIVEDNAEHVLDGVATVANRMVRSFPGIGVLVTSRIPLGLPDEVVRRVQVLGVPANDTDFTDIAASPAVEMFCRMGGAGPAGLRADSGERGDRGAALPAAGRVAAGTGTRGRSRGITLGGDDPGGSGRPVPVAVRAAAVRGSAPAHVGRHHRLER